MKQEAEISIKHDVSIILEQMFKECPSVERGIVQFVEAEPEEKIPTYREDFEICKADFQNQWEGAENRNEKDIFESVLAAKIYEIARGIDKDIWTSRKSEGGMYDGILATIEDRALILEGPEITKDNADAELSRAFHSISNNAFKKLAVAGLSTSALTCLNFGTINKTFSINGNDVSNLPGLPDGHFILTVPGNICIKAALESAPNAVSIIDNGHNYKGFAVFNYEVEIKDPSKIVWRRPAEPGNKKTCANISGGIAAIENSMLRNAMKSKIFTELFINQVKDVQIISKPGCHGLEQYREPTGEEVLTISKGCMRMAELAAKVFFQNHKSGTYKPSAEHA